MKTRLWKCRAVEAVENRTAVSHRSHRPWKSLRDSHIPTAPTNWMEGPIKTNKKGDAARTDPYFSGSSFDENMLSAQSVLLMSDRRLRGS